MTDSSRSSSPPPGSGQVSAYGYTETLERGTGKFASFAVAFAFVSIATGIFTTYGSLLNSSGPMGIWTWPIVIVGQLAVALLIGSLGRAGCSGCRRTSSPASIYAEARLPCRWSEFDVECGQPTQ